MTAYYDGTTGRGILEGDNAGWQRVSYSIPSAPSGTNQAIYVMRYWLEDYSVDGVYSGLTWPASCYYGLSFDGVHSDTNAQNDASYDNMMVAASADLTAPSNNDRLRIEIGSSLSAGYVSTSGNGWQEFYNANGGDTGLTGGGDGWNIFTKQEYGLTATHVWVVTGSSLDNSVSYKMWYNLGSINLDTFNIETDLDPDNPESSIPVSNSSDVDGNLQGDSFGTNWRPSDGVMAFPTYFLARWPARDQKMVISHIMGRYDSLTG